MELRNLTVGVGAALVDLLIEEDDAFVGRLGSAKGGMTLVKAEAIRAALAQTEAEPTMVPGGSACNTLVGLGRLGARARLIGRLGRDALGDAFHAGLTQAGVEARLRISPDAGTGHVLSVVTPDAQRTMFTHLGASSQLHPDDLEESDMRDADWAYLEGYLLFNFPVVERVLELAGRHRVRVALDLSSFEVVEACRARIDALLAQRRIDLVIANEDESRAYTGLGESDALAFLAERANLAVVKCGKHGALAARGSERADVAAHGVTAVDTTGAGDLWAAGFLFGWQHGLGLESSARLGCKLGAEVVQVTGAAIPADGWRRVHAYRDELMRE